VKRRPVLWSKQLKTRNRNKKKSNSLLKPSQNSWWQSQEIRRWMRCKRFAKWWREDSRSCKHLRSPSNRTLRPRRKPQKKITRQKLQKKRRKIKRSTTKSRRSKEKARSCTDNFHSGRNQVAMPSRSNSLLNSLQKPRKARRKRKKQKRKISFRPTHKRKSQPLRGKLKTKAARVTQVGAKLLRSRLRVLSTRGNR